MKKTWYRVTLDVAYEGAVFDRAGKIVAEEDRAKEIVTRVVKHDLDVALRTTSAGPVDWDLVKVVKKSRLPS